MTKNSSKAMAQAAIEIVTPEGMEGEALETRYTPLSNLKKWDRNPKKHNLRQLIEVFIKHGYWDPVTWDSKLNKGKGGIKAGNGRFSALSYMKDNDFTPPRGILVRKTDGEWMIPVNFGIDAASLIEAEAAGFDHNAATLFGSGLTDDQQMQIWNLDELRPMLREATEPTQLPLALQGMEEKKLEKLLGKDNLELEGGSGEPTPETKAVKGVPTHVRMYNLFLDTLTYPQFQRAIDRIKTVYGTQTGTDTVFRAILETADLIAPLSDEEKLREEQRRSEEAGDDDEVQEEVQAEQEIVQKVEEKAIPEPGDFIVKAPDDPDLCPSCFASAEMVVKQKDTGRVNVELRKACTCSKGFRSTFAMHFQEEPDAGDQTEPSAPY
jgi:hypothetical protein